MGFLLSRLQSQAEELLAAGEHAEAEALCCELLKLSSGTADLPVLRAAATVLQAAEIIDEPARRAALMALYNNIVVRQRGEDWATILQMCDTCLGMSEPYIVFHAEVLELAIFASARLKDHGRRLGYLARLVTCLGPPGGDPGEADGGIEATPEQGADAATRKLARNGVVLIRHLLDPARLDAMRRAASAMKGLLSLEATGIDEDELLNGAGRTFLDSVIAPLFPQAPVLKRHQSYLRYVSPTVPGAVPYHQDVNAFGRFLVNVWTPLVPCGRDAPGLEVVVRRIDALVDAMPVDSRFDEVEISEQLVRRIYGDAAIVTPEMVPGDVLILLGTTIHRTHMRAGMTEGRLSAELRFGLA
jgi:hypothetical protein